jgi:hypothetical protein
MFTALQLFYSKQSNDCSDFKLLVTLIYQGKYLIPEGKDLIYDISNRMNDNRLSTNSNSTDPSGREERIQSISNSHHSDPKDANSEGRAKVLSTGRYLRSIYIIGVYLESKEISQLSLLRSSML